MLLVSWSGGRAANILLEQYIFSRHPKLSKAIDSPRREAVWALFICRHRNKGDSRSFQLRSVRTTFTPRGMDTFISLCILIRIEVTMLYIASWCPYWRLLKVTQNIWITWSGKMQVQQTVVSIPTCLSIKLHRCNNAGFKYAHRKGIITILFIVQMHNLQRLNCTAFKSIITRRSQQRTPVRTT